MKVARTLAQPVITDFIIIKTGIRKFVTINFHRQSYRVKVAVKVSSNLFLFLIRIKFEQLLAMINNKRTVKVIAQQIQTISR